MTNSITRNADDAARGVYHFLDVGALKYGECTLVRFGDIAVLIDGSHEKDFDGQDGYDSVPDQLREIFGHDAPFDISLLVVTHGHADHIGCLPALVSAGVIRPRFALITDQKLGFGRSQDDADAPDLRDERTRALAAALREEDASDLDDVALQDFIDTVKTVESKYRAMVRDLRNKGVRVIEYRGRSLPSELVELMRPTNMTLLGPSGDQLVLAASQIASTNKDAADAVSEALKRDAGLSDVRLYRSLIDLDAFDDVRNPRGSGMNCQSITLAFGPPGARALLAGDMQFTDPNVTGAADEVARLRQRVVAAGPYRLFKTTHHTSHNGQDDGLLSELGEPALVVHSGGLHDATHPDPGTLGMLKALRPRITFARTDRNGRITVRPHLDGLDAVQVTRGRLNNFTPNGEDPLVAEPAAPAAAAVPPARQGGAQVIIVNLPDHFVDLTVAGVQIRGGGTGPAPAPARPDDEPARRRTPVPAPPSIALAGGRALPRLLFVTNSERLAHNIGSDEAAVALSAIRAARQPLCDLATTPGDPARTVRALLRSDVNVAGVVILGGYDVVAAPIVDVLSPRLRRELGANADRDHDRFLVWSDEPFGDIDGDHIAERPVSRVPDARDATLFLTALQAKPPRPAQRFGVRNVARPFANDVWNSVSGDGGLEVSEDFLSTDVKPEHAVSSYQYFMLHGDAVDATEFTGETDVGGSTRAFTIDRVPRAFSGVVFSGCCWGALTVSERAVDAMPGRAPAPRVAERSIALSYLKAGANAFIGCTGAHYSGPDPDPDENYAAPLHEAFWKMLARFEHAASKALFGARQYYGALLAANRYQPLDQARRLKNRAQFTCLGLGW